MCKRFILWFLVCEKKAKTDVGKNVRTTNGKRLNFNNLPEFTFRGVQIQGFRKGVGVVSCLNMC